MTTKHIDWDNGAVLEEHSKKKHAILQEYFRKYLITRCQLPKQERFRLVVVDGFAGGGQYQCGAFGSPLIFIDVLIHTINEINLRRSEKLMRPIQIECLIILNDSDKNIISLLKKNIAPHLLRSENTQNLRINVEYLSESFSIAYNNIKKILQKVRCGNVLFNLDQYSYDHVTTEVIRDIAGSWKKAEILLTFSIGSLLTFLSPNKELNRVPLEPELKKNIDAILENDKLLNKKVWLGKAEKIVFAYLKSCATYVSPFSIHNPDGWRYWLIHFANVYRARQVYNDVLHHSNSSQAHYGRVGLNMLSFDPRNDGQLYIFDDDSRKMAKESLYEDIPRLVAESGYTLLMEDFYAAAYSETPAHSEDIHDMIMENHELEVLTETGGKRRQANAIKPSDTLKLKTQKSFIFTFTDIPSKI